MLRFDYLFKKIKVVRCLFLYGFVCVKEVVRGCRGWLMAHLIGFIEWDWLLISNRIRWFKSGVTGKFSRYYEVYRILVAYGFFMERRTCPKVLVSALELTEWVSISISNLFDRRLFTGHIFSCLIPCKKLNTAQKIWLIFKFILLIPSSLTLHAQMIKLHYFIIYFW